MVEMSCETGESDHVYFFVPGNHGQRVQSQPIVTSLIKLGSCAPGFTLDFLEQPSAFSSEMLDDQA